MPAKPNYTTKNSSRFTMTGGVVIRENNREMSSAHSPKHMDSPNGGENDQKELNLVTAALSRVKASQYPIQETIWIQGPPGTKRTKLVQQIHRELEKNGAFIVRSKFDRTRMRMPYSTIADDFAQLFSHVMKSTAKNSIVAKLREEISDMGISMFLNAVPNARDLFEIEGNQEHNRSSHSLNNHEMDRSGTPSPNSVHQFHIIARDALRIITSELEPVVFVAEDFQLAHPSTLDFIKFLLINPSDTRFLLVGTCYRDESAVMSSDLSHFATALSEADIRFTRAFLDDGGPVSRAHYVRELDNKMAQLSTKTKQVLEVAALMGSYFQASMLETIMGSKDQIRNYDLSPPVSLVRHSDLVVEALKEALSSGVIECTADRYQFADDTSHECALRLIEENPDKKLLVFRVGKIMLDSKDRYFLVTALNHLNSVLDVIRPDSLYQMVMLNFEGAKQAASMTAYSTSAEYLQLGLDLLGDDKWSSDYLLTLKMTSMLAESALAARSYLGCKIAIDELVLHAQSFGEKLPVYYILIDSLRAQDRYDEAIEVGLQILQALGEKIRPKSFRLPTTIAKLRSAVNKIAPSFASNSMIMTDANSLEICKLLHALAEISWLSSQQALAVQFQCRIVQLSLKYGRCNYSALGFAGFGIGLCICEYFDDANRDAQLTLQLSKDCPDALAEGLVYFFVDHWRRPFTDGLSNLEDVTQISLDNGRVSSAMYASFSHLSLCLNSGQPLQYLCSLYRETVDQLTGFSETYVLMKTIPEFQFVLNMTGGARDVLVLDGDAMMEDTFVKDCEEVKDDCPIMYMHFQKMKLAYYFGNYEKAYEYKQHISKFDSKRFSPRAFRTTTVLFGGLAAVEMYKITLRKKYLQEAKKEVVKLQKWKKAGVINAHHTALLLEAEIAAVNRASNTKALFNQAIEAATQISYAHDRALANERAGVHCLSDNDTGSACDYMVEATRMYNRWEASAKVAQIKTKYPYLFYDHNSAVSSKHTIQRPGGNPATGNLRGSSAVGILLPTIQSSGDRNEYSRRRPPADAARGSGGPFNRRRYSSDDPTTSDASW